MNDIVAAVINETFDVRHHLTRMRAWQDEWFREDEQLRERLRSLKTSKPLDKQLVQTHETSSIMERGGS